MALAVLAAGIVALPAEAQRPPPAPTAAAAPPPPAPSAAAASPKPDATAKPGAPAASGSTNPLDIGAGGDLPIAVEAVSKQKFAAWVEEAKKKFASNDPAAVTPQIAEEKRD